MVIQAALTLLFAMQQSVAVEQVSSGPDDTRSAATLDQLSTRDQSAVETVQKTPDDRAPDDMAQLSTPDNDVEFARIEGFDRCSAELLSASDAAFCSRRLETRSDEFRTENARLLSAEEVLISERAAAGAQGVADASRTIGVRGASAEDRDNQALASLTLGQPAPPQDTPEETGQGDLPAETQALIQAIVNQLTTTPGG